MDFDLYFQVRVRQMVGAIKTVRSTGAYIAGRMDRCNGVIREECQKKAGEFRLTGGDVDGGFMVRALEDQKK